MVHRVGNFLPAMVMAFSCMVPAVLICVFGGVRLISSANKILANTGPFINLKFRFWSRISAPIISEGMRSGVNWTRLKLKPSTFERVLTIKVLANPGTPTNNTCPLLKTEIKIFLITASCPTMVLLISLSEQVVFFYQRVNCFYV